MRGEGTPARPGPPAASAPALPVVRDEVTGAVLHPGRPLVWGRVVPLATDFELLQGEAMFGEMEQAADPTLDATGECLGQTLGLRLDVRTFGRVYVETLRGQEGEPGPSFRGLTFGWGRVATSGGEALRWRRPVTRLYTHVLLDAGGREILRMYPPFLRFALTETRARVTPLGWGRVDLAELLLLTWFLRVHTERAGRRVFRRRGGAPALEAPPANASRLLRVFSGKTDPQNRSRSP